MRRDERRPFTDRSLYTADSEDEDDRTRSKKTAVKVEDQPSGFEGEGNADAQKPLNSKIVSKSVRHFDCLSEGLTTVCNISVRLTKYKDDKEINQRSSIRIYTKHFLTIICLMKKLIG